jgi:hypothetical protein
VRVNESIMVASEISNPAESHLEFHMNALTQIQNNQYKKVM